MSSSRWYVPVVPESASASTCSGGAADLTNADDAVSTDFDGDSGLDNGPLTLAGLIFVTALEFYYSLIWFGGRVNILV
jgi:hypothetical protein